MARLVKGCPTPYPQRGAGKPGTNISVTHQEEQANVTEGRLQSGCRLQTRGIQPWDEAVNEEKKISDAEYAKIELPQDSTLHQRTMYCKVAERISWVHWQQGPKIVASWLQDMCLQLRFSSESARLLVEEQQIDSPDKNVNYICNVMRKPGGKNANGTPNSSRWQP